MGRIEALAAAHEAVELRRELVAVNRNAYLPKLAASVNNQAVRLAEVGRRAEALAAAQEAVELYRELVAVNRDAYLPDLAGMVGNLAVRLAEVGQQAEALTVAHEATRLYRLAQHIHGDVYADDVAQAERLIASLSDAAENADPARYQDGTEPTNTTGT